MISAEKSFDDEISYSEIIQYLKNWIKYIKPRFIIVISISIIGGLIGVLYSSIQETKYSAKITFVVEDSKSSSSSLGGLASLAGQFEVDVAGTTGGGLFAGDNILLYFKSPSLAREVLMSTFDTKSKRVIADVYCDVYDLKDKWKSKGIKKINFSSIISDSEKRQRDSLLNLLVDDILKLRFNVFKTDKKGSFIDVVVTTDNELLSKVYCEKIVQKAVERYVLVKTQRQKITVDQLQSRVDSISYLLRQKTFSGASLQTSSSTMDINPLYKTNSTVAVETTVREKSMLATIFASVTQNLEMAKFTLSQETPVIQIVDSPILPLKEIKMSKVKTGLIFSFFSFALAIFTLTLIWLRKK